MAQSNKLKWRFDVNTFRLLGRDLITDRITALFELVKNSYDANAKDVNIEFLNVGTCTEGSRIIIQDDGIGMTLKDIEDKWMVIGTNSKRKELYSPEPFKRRYVGEKGIGRFAVDKLGQYVKIRTKQKEDEKELIVTINWETYQTLAEGDQTKLNLFTDIENEYEWVEPSFTEGTVLEIYYPREIWILDDINRTYKELSRLVSPFHKAKYPFNIFIQATEFEPYLESKIVENDEKRFASHQFELNYNLDTDMQEVLFFDETEQKIKIVNTEKLSFGFIKFYLYYFDQEAKNRFNTFYKGTSVRIDGVKIYRDGILTTPFAEYEADNAKRRDVLGIDKRRWRETFNRIGTRDCIGFIEITREGNPQIIDSTNRQDFLATPQYSDIKTFIYEQLDIFMLTRKVEREEKTKERLTSFDTTKVLVDDLRQQLMNLRKATTEKTQKRITDAIAEKLPLIEKGLQDVTTEYKETKKDEVRKEKMYFSLMSLSLFAANVSHAVRTSIYAVNDDTEFLQDEINDDGLKSIAARINREIQRLKLVVDFMLKYAQTDLPAEYFNVNELINNAFEVHESIFLQKKITTQLDIESRLSLFGNQVFFQDIITCLISNSIKALEGNFTKKISCIAKAHDDKIEILFSDNGIGIPLSKRDWVFGMYNTTTQEQGGAGIGLYVVKTNVEALGGKVTIEDNSEMQEGITFKITIPFKK